MSTLLYPYPHSLLFRSEIQSHHSIFVSPKAIEQWLLMLIHDQTLLERSYLRLHIEGKGCDGFDYAVIFDQLKDKDIVLFHEQQDFPQHTQYPALHLVIDSFTSFYLQQATLDYLWDPEQNQDGFYLLNHNQEQFQGKFWKDNPEKIPYHLSASDPH
jgi:iron-sulfur cluster insertion protein